MTENFGVSTTSAFHTQIVRTTPPKAGDLPAGLDPDDARIVNENYRQTLTRKGNQTKTPPSSVIVVEDQDEKGAKSKK